MSLLQSQSFSLLLNTWDSEKRNNFQKFKFCSKCLLKHSFILPLCRNQRKFIFKVPTKINLIFFCLFNVRSTKCACDLDAVYQQSESSGLDKKTKTHKSAQPSTSTTGRGEVKGPRLQSATTVQTLADKVIGERGEPM